MSQAPNVLTSPDHLFDPGDAGTSAEVKPDAAAGEAATEADHLAAIVDLERRLHDALVESEKRAEEDEERHAAELAAATQQAHLQGYEQARGEVRAHIGKLRLFNVDRTGPSGRQMVAAEDLTSAIRLVQERVPESDKDRVRSIGDAGVTFIV